MPYIVFVSDDVLLRKPLPTVKAGALFSIAPFPWDSHLHKYSAPGGDVPLFQLIGCGFHF